MRFLIHCPASSGGLAEHVHYQAKALVRRGFDVTVLCSEDFLQGRRTEYSARRIYPSLTRGEALPGTLRRARRLLAKVIAFLWIQWRLAWEVLRGRPDVVLLDTFMEYLSPVWIWPHFLARRLTGAIYVANLHDPVRDFVVGPLWWHKLSVSLAYKCIDVCMVHQSLSREGIVPRHVVVTEAPVGVYDLQETYVDAQQVRESWGITKGNVVFLSFGFVRDNKNIDLLIRALPANPAAFLVVMGSAQSSKNKSLDFYRKLARSEGVADRVVFREEFVQDEALGGYFQAADFIAITYNSEFYSQSGVLNIAARAKKPVLASSGDSPLKDCVQRFSLGMFVRPDELAEVQRGMKVLCDERTRVEPTIRPDWDGYTAYASWDSNIGLMLQAIQAAARCTKKS